MNKDEIFAAMETHANSVPELPPGPIAKRESPLDKTSMSYWFPLIEAAGLPVPKTKFVEMTDTCRRMIWDAFDGKNSGDVTTEPFFARIAEAASEMGYPCFLRTDHTSASSLVFLRGWVNTFAGLPGISRVASSIRYSRN